MSEKSSVYSAAGVDYALLDAGKRNAIAAARSTSPFAAQHGAVVNDLSRGEPAFTFAMNGTELAMVMECLGTKSSIAAEFELESGVNRFDWVGYDGVSAIVNDLCSVGALPLVVSAYFATGSPAWYNSEGRFDALVEGWRHACEDSAAVWGGGESPMLAGIIEEGQLDLGGSAVGYFPPGRRPLLGVDLGAGDEIVLIESSGIHTNGNSLARQTAGIVGWSHELPDGSSFGDAVLTPSIIYVKLLRAVVDADIPLHYASHITGHGLRKLMRADRELTYRIDTLLPSMPVFDVMVEVLGLDAETAYGTFNMGAGFALICPAGNASRIVEAAQSVGLAAVHAGNVEEGPRRVILREVGVMFSDEDLQLR